MLAKLLTWFYEVRENYPFRQQRNPYRVWISEVVLQQTRIQAALVPLERFFLAFPDVFTLAYAKEEEVLHAFRGLGYYSRAKNLQKGAKYLVEKHKGEMPQKYEDLIQVPSIGEYTAAAVSSICFGEKNPVLDGNVKRIVARLLKLDLPMNASAFVEKAYAFLRALFAPMDLPAGDVNEAWMELGQKICLKTRPQCHSCPIASECMAWKSKEVAKYPLVSKKAEKIPVLWHLYIVKNRENQILMQRWEDFYFLKGQFSFPSVLEFPKTRKELVSWQGFRMDKSQSDWNLKPIKHSITRHAIGIYPYVLAFPPKSDLPPGCVWIPEKEVRSKLVASALMKVWKEYEAQKQDWFA